MSLPASTGHICMRTPELGSILLASTNPDRLRSWYERAFAVTPNADGFLAFGGVDVLIDQRNDVAERCVESGRVILNFHVDDAHAVAAHLDGLGVTWIAPLEFRREASSSKKSTYRACTQSTAWPKSRAIIRPQEPRENGPRGSATAKATCSVSASRSETVQRETRAESTEEEAEPESTSKGGRRFD